MINFLIYKNTKIKKIIKMNLFSQDEVERIQKSKETNDRLEEFFNDKRSEWNTNIDPLFKSLSLDLSVPSNSKNILET